MADREQTFETFEDSASKSDASEVRSPWLFAVLHCDEPSAGGARWRLDRTDAVTFRRGSSSSTRTAGADGNELTLSIPSPFASREHAQLIRARGTWVLVDRGSRNGTLLNGERVSRAPLSDGDVVVVGHTLFVFKAALATPPDSGDLALDGKAAHTTLVPALAERARLLERVARSRVPILLHGESGAGKEVAARAVHAASGRSGELVAVNCGGIPEGLMEAALFGHTRGAFSGAMRDEPGFIRSAEAGTLFLDEVADLRPAAQTALLRVLEDQTVVPLGSTRPIPVDVRFVAATHRSLHQLVAQGAFRHDLFARLNGFAHTVPPMRDRVLDLGLLLANLLAQAGATTTTFTVDASLAMIRHSWPLNVRELRQCLMSALALAGNRPIDVEHLPEALRSATASTPSTDADDDLQHRLRASLEEHEGNVAAVARSFGKAPVQIHRWMRRWGLDVNTFRRGKHTP